MTDNTELRQDLDALLARVSMNWSSYQDPEVGRIGDGACLLTNMSKILSFDQRLRAAFWNSGDIDQALHDVKRRQNNMILALDFRSAGETAGWNDAQDSNEPVLRRIKDAIEGLG